MLVATSPGDFRVTARSLVPTDVDERVTRLRRRPSAGDARKRRDPLFLGWIFGRGRGV